MLVDPEGSRFPGDTQDHSKAPQDDLYQMPRTSLQKRVKMAMTGLTSHIFLFAVYIYIILYSHIIYIYNIFHHHVCQRQKNKPVKCPTRLCHALSICLVIIGYINHSQGYDKMELYHAISSCQHTYFMNSRLGAQTIESSTGEYFIGKHVEPLLHTSIEFYPLIISANEHIPVATSWKCFVAVLQCPF